jgi:hypothetical protein
VWPERDRAGRKRRWVAILASLAAHSLLFFVVVEGRLPRLSPRRPGVVILQIPAPEPILTTPTPFYVPRQERGQGRALVPVRPSRPLPEREEPRRAGPEYPVPPDTGGVARSPVGRIGPALGTGRLWVRPLPLPPKELAARLKPSHEALVDSAVTAIVQGYLDSIAREPGADQVKLPDWTTEVAGAKFGLDSRNIYIAGLKIPAVLALLPIPSVGNQQRALDHNAEWIAEDLRRAAQRAATLDEFKQAVRELRERKKYEKDLEQAQREKPDSGRSHEQ